LADDDRHSGSADVKARLNGIEINYEVHGEGTPLVLAHGYTASLDMWREQVPAFSARYRLVIYDTRGHGATTAPVEPDRYNLARDYVADQLALMDHLRIDAAYVGGLSMGGMIAQEFALQHPERVKALLLFDTGPGMSGLPRQPEIRARLAQAQHAVRAAARAKGMSAIVDGLQESAAAFVPPDAGTLSDAVRRHMENMRRMSVDGLVGANEAMHNWPGTYERLAAITAPTLIMVGQEDPLLTAANAMHRTIRGSRLVVLRRSGHGTNMWRPDSFARRTLEFLADVEAGRRVARYIVSL
jgi:pimeloyl-ACP methyl ester carboxylesterase